MKKRILHIEGMHCEHCRAKVENALNGLEGIRAEVNLKKGTAAVLCPEETEDASLSAVVIACGFTVTKVESKNKFFSL